MVDTATEPAAAAPPARPRRLDARVPAVLGLYLLASLALNHRVVGHLGSASTGRIQSDAGLFTWWLGWASFSLTHGLNPLYSTWMNYPAGVNAMWNTAVPVLGMLFAPVTLAFGALVAYNVAMILGPVASGFALLLAARPYVPRLWPRAVAGLAYGFSPFMVAHAAVGHLNLVWMVLPPALLAAVHAILLREQPRPLRAGVLLGVVFAGQTLLYTQTVALGAVALVVTAAVLAARWPGRARERARQVGLAAAGCAVTYAVLCAYPLYLILAGPSRPRVPIREPGEYVTDLANLVVPTEVTWWRPFAPAAGQLRGYYGEQGGYLGIPLLAVLVLTMLLCRRPAVRVTASVGALLVLLSLGPHLVLLGRDTGVPGPWLVVSWLPLVHQAEPMRMQAFVALCVALLLAYWLDRLGGFRPAWVRAGCGVLTALALLSWLPSDALRTVPISVPAAFTGDALRPGDVVESYPAATGAWETGGAALQWQAAAGMRYRLTSGYFIGSDAARPLLLESPPSAFRQGVTALARGGPPPEPAAARDGLRRSGVTVVAVAGPAAGNPRVLGWTRLVTGVRGEEADGAWLFRLPR
ncbi:MAG TPA: hypothetical protein VGH99_13940 [Pseudonocardia sp.]